MSHVRQLSVAIWVVLTAVCGAIAAEGRLRCAVCQSIVSGAFYWYQPAGQVGKQPVCETCSKLESTCAVCRLPVRPTGRRLEDGRWLCEHDLQAGVFTQTEATHIYEETWRALQGILAGTGTLPRHNITVALVDLRELKKQKASL